MNKQIFSLILGTTLIATTPGFAMEKEDHDNPTPGFARAPEKFSGFPKTAETRESLSLPVESFGLNKTQRRSITIRQDMEYEQLLDAIGKVLGKRPNKLGYRAYFPSHVPPSDITAETWPLLINDFLSYSNDIRQLDAFYEREIFCGFPALPEGISSKKIGVVARDLPGELRYNGSLLIAYAVVKDIMVLKGMEYKDLLNNIEAVFEKRPVALEYIGSHKEYSNAPKDTTEETWPLLINGLIYYHEGVPSINAYFKENVKDVK
jgi:hypothetical protein